MEQIYTPKQDYKVLVRCFTYNQSKYIEDALNGFAMQKTDFPFVCLIMDDCSTDGEQEVIKAWMERECDMTKAEYCEDDLNVMIYVRHRTNTNCYFSFNLLKRNLYKEKYKKGPYVKCWRNHCVYEALCEGDDYWVYSTKLQQQVDYLDNNPDCSMCFHQAYELWEGQDKSERVFANLENRDYTGVEIFENWIVATASVVYRWDCRDSQEYKAMMKGTKFIFGDTPLFVALSKFGKVHAFSDTMSVYRRSETGATFANFKGNIDRELRRANHFLEFYRVFGDEFRQHSVKMYQICMLRIVRHYPMEINKWRKMFVKAITLSPMNFIKLALRIEK